MKLHSNECECLGCEAQMKAERRDSAEQGLREYRNYLERMSAEARAKGLGGRISKALTAWKSGENEIPGKAQVVQQSPLITRFCGRAGK